MINDISEIPSVDAQAAMTAEMNERIKLRGQCVWAKSEDWNGDPEWKTQCGQIQLFGECTPNQNQYAYCPYCGKSLVVK